MRPRLEDTVVMDFETHVEKGYSLERMSARAYITDSRFDILTVAICVGAAKDIRFYQKLGRNGDSLEEARALLADLARAGKCLVAHNMGFEALILALRWGIVFSRMFDTTGYLRARGMAASLENGAHLVGLRKLTAPPFNAATLAVPSELAQIARYNAMDVLIARQLLLQAIADEDFTELEFWACGMTARENVTGIAVDRDEAARLGDLLAHKRDQLLESMCREYPAFDTTKLGSPLKVRQFCKAAFRVDLASLDRKDRDLTRARATNAGLAEFLALRDGVATLMKYAKLMKTVAVGAARIYSPLRYFGSHTGRFSASGRDADKLNVQNLPRGDGAQPELKLLRGVLRTDARESWVSSDLATIEPRVMAFAAGEHELVEQFRRGEDVYITFGARAFPGVPIVKGGENNHLRHICKQAVIALGFGMGVKRFHQRLLEVAPDVEFKDAERLHSLYRDAFPRIVELRQAYYSAFTDAFENGARTQVGGCEFERQPGPAGAGYTVRVWLPTRRPLYYPSIEAAQQLTPWAEWIPGYWYASAYQFDGSAPHKGKHTARVRKSADGRYRELINPPSLIENIVQATARDLLVGQMREVEQAGLRVRFSVHDELVVACGRCSCPRRDAPVPRGGRVDVNHEPGCAWVAARATVSAVMSRVPECFPGLAGLPVSCELSDTIRDRYGK